MTTNQAKNKKNTQKKKKIENLLFLFYPTELQNLEIKLIDTTDNIVKIPDSNTFH